jgi:hypothetical protein
MMGAVIKESFTSLQPSLFYRLLRRPGGMRNMPELASAQLVINIITNVTIIYHTESLKGVVLQLHAFLSSDDVIRILERQLTCTLFLAHVYQGFGNKGIITEESFERNPSYAEEMQAMYAASPGLGKLQMCIGEALYTHIRREYWSDSSKSSLSSALPSLLNIIKSRDVLIVYFSHLCSPLSSDTSRQSLARIFGMQLMLYSSFAECPHELNRLYPSLQTHYSMEIAPMLHTLAFSDTQHPV